MMFRNLYILGKIFTAYSLLVTPQTVPELEGDLEANFFCRENNNSYASPRAIVWQDPWGNVYIPGSLSIEGNSRISADGSRLQIVRVVRNDAGIYRCRRNNNPADFAEGNLLVHAPPAILNTTSVQEIYLGKTSLIKCEVDRGSPLANIHWLHVQYHNETGQQKLTEITNSSDPRFTIVSDGLQITNVQHSDDGTYRCYVYNSYGTVFRDIHAVIGAPPQPTLKFYNRYITLDQLEMINCTVSAFPRPNLQWIQQSSGELFPESSWVTTYHDKMVYTTLMYTFRALDFNGRCATVVVCKATNAYGASEQYFTLDLNNCSSTSSTHAHATPTSLPNVSISNHVQRGKSTLILSIAAPAVTLMFAVLLIILVLLLLRCCVLRWKKSSSEAGMFEADSVSTGSEISSVSQSKNDIFCTACKTLHDSNSPCIPSPLFNLNPKHPQDHCYSQTGITVVVTEPNQAYGKFKRIAPPDIKPHEYETIPMRAKNSDTG